MWRTQDCGCAPILTYNNSRIHFCNQLIGNSLDLNNRFSCCPVGWVGSGVKGKAENRLHSQVNKAPDKALSASLAETIIILAGGSSPFAIANVILMRFFFMRYVKTSFVKFVPRPLFHQWPPGGALAVNCVNKSSFHGQFLGTRPKSNAILVFKAISNFVNF